MHKYSIWKKGLVVGVIFLFFGAAIIPGITAITNLSNTKTIIESNIEFEKFENKDLVEVTLSYYKNNEIKK